MASFVGSIARLDKSTLQEGKYECFTEVDGVYTRTKLMVTVSGYKYCRCELLRFDNATHVTQ